MFFPIQLDKVRNFRYGMKALSLIEKKLKTTMSKLDMDTLSVEDTAVIIWAGLVHEDRDLTPDKVMDLVDEYSNMATVIEAMGKAMNESFGEKDEKN